MQFDQTNPVVKLCVDGMNAEATGDIDQATTCFTEAWNMAGDDFERFTAAHYMARNQADKNTELKWNLTSLEYAGKIGDDAVKAQLPSLFLNAGRSYEQLGDLSNAAVYYKKAAENAQYLPVGQYTEMIRNGIAAALKRAGVTVPGSEVLDEMIDRWCVRKNLRALAVVLPPYVGSLGAGADTNRLVDALSRLSAMQVLTDAELEQIRQLIADLSKQDV